MDPGEMDPGEMDHSLNIYAYIDINLFCIKRMNTF